MDEITSGHSSQVLAWLEARGGDAVALYAMDQATRCDLGAECPDGCGALDDYTVTFNLDTGKWTVRSNTDQPLWTHGPCSPPRASTPTLRPAPRWRSRRTRRSGLTTSFRR